jgi:hypothetical protein
MRSPEMSSPPEAPGAYAHTRSRPERADLTSAYEPDTGVQQAKHIFQAMRGRPDNTGPMASFHPWYIVEMFTR